MKSALLSLLGLNLNSSLHFNAAPNDSFDLISRYLSKVYESSPCSLMASSAMTTALEYGFKHLIEGTISKNDCYIYHISETSDGDLFNITMKLPCVSSNLYYDYLANEISEYDCNVVANSLFLEVTLDAVIDLESQAFSLDTRILKLTGINGLSSCFLEDVLSYCYEPTNDILALKEKLNNSVNIFDGLNIVYLKQAKALSSIPLSA